MQWLSMNAMTLSEVIWRRRWSRPQALPRRITPDRVIAFRGQSSPDYRMADTGPRRAYLDTVAEYGYILAIQRGQPDLVSITESTC
jgi:hypothetical protein